MKIKIYNVGISFKIKTKIKFLKLKSYYMFLNLLVKVDDS